ncbi:MAG: hypothetical protein H6Q52_1029 [Deltaproteobacteria bacterium]|nr:hypothetical protein [Deltaproteobacteria bacterium]
MYDKIEKRRPGPRVRTHRPVWEEDTIDRFSGKAVAALFLPQGGNFRVNKADRGRAGRIGQDQSAGSGSIGDQP